MSVCLDDIQYYTVPGLIGITVPENRCGQNKPISGQLYLSQQEYFYAGVSKPVIWLKFAGLTIILPFMVCAHKCHQLFKCCFGKQVSAKGLHDLSHAKKLYSIAFKAVIGWGKDSLFESVEKFALAELDYNNGNRSDELDKPRSQRFKQGYYVARCMQPLFHKKALDHTQTLRTRIEHLSVCKDQMEDSLRRKRKLQENASTYPYAEFSKEQLVAGLEEVNSQLKAAKQFFEASERCQKYAVQAILSQQSYISDSYIKSSVREEKIGYKHDKYCGCIYKVDCCAVRCWAIDCFCCMCCIFPEGRSCGVIGC